MTSFAVARETFVLLELSPLTVTTGATVSTWIVCDFKELMTLPATS